MRANSQLSSEAFWRELEDMYRRAWLASHSQDSYEIDGAPCHAMIGSWHLDAGPRQLEYREAGVEVLIQSEDTQALNANQMMLTFEQSFDDVLTSRRNHTVLANPDRVCNVEVDGLPRAMRVWDIAEGWWGSIDIGPTHVAIRAVGYDLAVMKLHRVKDLAPYIDARLCWLREQRGE